MHIMSTLSSLSWPPQYVANTKNYKIIITKFSPFPVHVYSPHSKHIPQDCKLRHPPSMLYTGLCYITIKKHNITLKSPTDTNTTNIPANKILNFHKNINSKVQHMFKYKSPINSLWNRKQNSQPLHYWFTLRDTSGYSGPGIQAWKKYCAKLIVTDVFRKRNKIFRLSF
jgi:hypothetical protein